MAKRNLGEEAWRLIKRRFAACLRSPEAELMEAGEFARQTLPEDKLPLLDKVLNSRRISYRDAVIIQLAYGLCDRNLDLTKRQPGARTVSQKLGAFFASRHIKYVKDAYQNIAKNTPELVRGNFEDFDGLLTWLSLPERCGEELGSAFSYSCAVVASTARPVRTMPELDLGNLTFATCSQIISGLFGKRSQGAYEQFTVAALMQALLEQSGSPYRVETKNLTASDKSSRVAGDVQILSGNRLIEAYEVTAGSWEAKLDHARDTIRDHDLSRIHIVASTGHADHHEKIASLGALDYDVSILETEAFAKALLSGLTRDYRAQAFRRLYELLDRYQPDTSLVNAFVETLTAHKAALRE